MEPTDIARVASLSDRDVSAMETRTGQDRTQALTPSFYGKTARLRARTNSDKCSKVSVGSAKAARYTLHAPFFGYLVRGAGNA